MRGVLAATITAALLLAAGCGAEDPEAPVTDTGGEGWEGMVAALPTRADPDSRNPCGSGSPECIDLVIAEMQRRLEALAAACDHDAAFALMYLRVTEAVGQQRARRFRDPRYLNHLDADFAELYFDAFDAWHSGNDEAVPEAWRIAFEAADERALNGLGDMLVGMNAHISRDLPYAVEEVGLRDTRGKSAERDFDAVNSLLEEVQGPILAEESDRFDPGIEEATLPALEIDAASIGELLARWRSEAFVNGQRLLAAEGSERDAVAEEIDEAAAGRARLIEALTSNLVIGPGAEERRRFCEERAG